MNILNYQQAKLKNTCKVLYFFPPIIISSTTNRHKKCRVPLVHDIEIFVDFSISCQAEQKMLQVNHLMT